MRTPQPSPKEYTDDEIDLRQLITVLWQQKALIAGIVIVGALLGVGSSLNSTRYVTEGLFLTPGVLASDYKRYENVVSNGARLQQYLQHTDQARTSEGQLIFKLGDDHDRLAETLKPEFAFTERDSKTYGVKVNGDDSGALIGVRMRFSDTNPTGGTPIVLLAEYVRDSVIRVDMEGITLNQCNLFRSREQELRNTQIQSEFAIRQEQDRAANLRAIVDRTPAAGTIDSRQIVSLDKGNERFLSPAAQLIASEIQIADMKLAEVGHERDRIASALKRDYYCQAQQAAQRPITGRAFLEELKNIHATVFQKQDKSIDIVEQTWNELDVERANWTNTYLQGMRFVASPEGTERKQRKPGLALGLVLGGMLGGMFGVMLALVRAWWRGNADQTTAKPKA